MIELSNNGQLLHLRETLFWDINPKNLDVDNSVKIIIERVLTRGNLDEFNQLLLFYPVMIIRETLLKIGYLDDKTLNFSSWYFKIPENEFLCYKKRL